MPKTSIDLKPLLTMLASSLLSLAGAFYFLGGKVSQVDAHTDAIKELKQQQEINSERIVRIDERTKTTDENVKFLVKRAETQSNTNK
jgi:hypothetical protein